MAHYRARTPRVLLVEDDLLAKEALAYILEFEGYSVATAGDGAQGLMLLHHSPRPSAVILDLGLPVVSGREFLRQQKHDPLVANIPVIVVTGAFSPTVPDACAVLTKPVDVSKLIALLREHCAVPDVDA
jgi:two-component system, response regulator, stage 0 sporulation protein F